MNKSQILIKKGKPYSSIATFARLSEYRICLPSFPIALFQGIKLANMFAIDGI